MIYEIRGVEFMLSMVWVIYRKYDRYKECIEMRKNFKIIDIIIVFFERDFYVLLKFMLEIWF